MSVGDTTTVDEESAPLAPTLVPVTGVARETNNNSNNANNNVELYGSITNDEKISLQQQQEIATTEEEKSSSCISEQNLCRTFLLSAALLYGSLNVVLRWLYELPGPPTASALSTTRGWLAVTCFVPFLLGGNTAKSRDVMETNNNQNNDLKKTTTYYYSTAKPLWMAALELAVWNFGAQGLQNIGLLSVESARVSFLTQTSVVMTPVVSAMMGQRVHKTVWLGCFCAMGGIALLSDDNGTGFGKGLTVGDFICLAGALSWSIYIFRLSSLSEYYSEIELQAVKNVFLACLYTTWFGISLWQHWGEESLWPGWTNLASWALLFYSALGPGTVADLMQQKGQTKVSASEANVILSIEPVCTAILGLVLLGESTSLQELLGGGLIIAAAIVASI